MRERKSWEQPHLLQEELYDLKCWRNRTTVKVIKENTLNRGGYSGLALIMQRSAWLLDYAVALKTYRGVEMLLHAFLISALVQVIR